MRRFDGSKRVAAVLHLRRSRLRGIDSKTFGQVVIRAGQDRRILWRKGGFIKFLSYPSIELLDNDYRKSCPDHESSKGAEAGTMNASRMPVTTAINRRPIWTFSIKLAIKKFNAIHDATNTASVSARGSRRRKPQG